MVRLILEFLRYTSEKIIKGFVTKLANSHVLCMHSIQKNYRMKELVELYIVILPQTRLGYTRLSHLSL